MQNGMNGEGKQRTDLLFARGISLANGPVARSDREELSDRETCPRNFLIRWNLGTNANGPEVHFREPCIPELTREQFMEAKVFLSAG